MLNRRTFLRVLGSAAVGVAAVAVVPDLLVNVVTPLACGPAWDTSTAPPLTYEMLEAAYKSCLIGSEQPTMMIVSRSTARQLGLIYDVELEEAA